MSVLSDTFQACSQRVSCGAIGGLSRENQLKLYAYYSIATKGEPPAQGPHQLLNPRGSAKWCAWDAERGTTVYVQRANLGSTATGTHSRRMNGGHICSVLASLTQVLLLQFCAQRNYYREEAMQQYVALVDSLERIPEAERDSSDDGFHGMGNDASIKGFTIPHEDGPSAESQQVQQQRFDLTHWASVDDVKSTRFCLQHQGVSPDYRDEDNLTALMRAADRGANDALRLLLDAGADVDAKDDDGQTALHYAAICGQALSAALLVQQGANMDARDVDGTTPLDNADKDGDVRAAMVAALSHKQSPGYGLYHAAAAGAIIAALLAAGLIWRAH